MCDVNPVRFCFFFLFGYLSLLYLRGHWRGFGESGGKEVKKRVIRWLWGRYTILGKGDMRCDIRLQATWLRTVPCFLSGSPLFKRDNRATYHIAC